MIVERKKLSLWERLFVSAFLGGCGVIWKHFVRTVFRRQNAAVITAGGYHPEVKWVVQEGYRGAPYLVKDQEGRTKCVSCQLCEFVCPPKAIKIMPPGPAADPATGNVEKQPRDFRINMLRCIFCGFCQEVCPEEAIFLMKDYSLVGLTRKEMVFDKEKLLALGGTRPDATMTWKKKAEEARAQENFNPEKHP